jgi:hypothetical protein
MGKPAIIRLSSSCHPELVGATLREDSFRVSGSVVTILGKIPNSEINSRMTRRRHSNRTETSRIQGYNVTYLSQLNRTLSRALSLASLCA